MDIGTNPHASLQKELCDMAREKPGDTFDPQTFFARAGKGRKVTNYRKGALIFQQGEAADAVFYIQKGEVRLSVVSGQGKEAVVSLLRDDDFIGEGSVSGQPLRIASAHALTEATLARIEKAEMVRLMREHSQFSQFFTEHILKRAMRSEADLIDQLFNSSERRLARLLLILANYGNEGKPQPILAKISQETLAHMIGTTRSRVSFFMNRFRKLGFISYNGHIEVHKALLTLVLHDQPHIKGQPPYRL